MLPRKKDIPGDVVGPRFAQPGNIAVFADSSGKTIQDSGKSAASASSSGVTWGQITGTLAAQTDLGSALGGKASATHPHTPGDVTGTAVVTGDSRLTDARTPLSHGHSPGDVTGTAVTTNDARLTDARAPTAHGHAPGDVTGTAVVTADARLSDARTPTAHSHTPSEVTGTAVVTADSRLSDARTPVTHDSTKHSVAYEAANANIQTHVISAHAPSNAQKNSDITKAEIEAKLTGEIATHTHAGGSGDPFLVKLRLAGDITNATVTPAVLTGMVFSYLANSFYVFDMYMLCTSVAATTGYGFAVDVSAAVTNVALSFTHQLATGGTCTGGDSIADNVSRGLSSGVPAITVVNFVMGSGILMTGANPGMAQFMFRPEVAASATCKAGSVIRVMKIS